MCFDRASASGKDSRCATSRDPEPAKRHRLFATSCSWMSQPLRLVVSDGLPAGEAVSEAQSFEEFFEAESRAMFRRLCLVTGNRHDAEEVMQDAFLNVLERWDRVRQMEDPTGYLYRTAFNVFKRRSRRAAMALRRTFGVGETVDEFAAADARFMVEEGLSELSPRQRAAIVLTELLGFSSESAGRVLGVRPVTVRALASQGRAVMKRTLERDDA
jgi:RNA polymerase sigma-70 factor (ECF subfamily)